MAREIITIECTEARKEGKSPSRYTTTRNKKLKTEKLEIKKHNPPLRRHTLPHEIKSHLGLPNPAQTNRRNAVDAVDVLPSGKRALRDPSQKSISPWMPWTLR